MRHCRVPFKVFDSLVFFLYTFGVLIYFDRVFARPRSFIWELIDDYLRKNNWLTIYTCYIEYVHLLYSYAIKLCVRMFNI